MRRIAVINQKGGVGKTTTTASLGAAVAAAGRRVLLIDLDPQAHLTLHFGTELSRTESSIYDVLTNSLPVDEVVRDVGECIALLPAHIDLASAEAELVSVPGREVILKQALEQAGTEFEVLLIDCPPSLGTLTINALVACNEVLIPLQAHFLALQGLSRLLDTVSLVQARINPELRIAGIALCMHEASTRLATEVVEDLKGFLNSARGTPVPWADAVVYSSFVRRNIKLAEASSYGQTVFTYAPRSNGALDYADLAHEIFGLQATAEAQPPAAEQANSTEEDEAETVTAVVPAPEPPPATDSSPPAPEPSTCSAEIETDSVAQSA